MHVRLCIRVHDHIGVLPAHNETDVVCFRIHDAVKRRHALVSLLSFGVSMRRARCVDEILPLTWIARGCDIDLSDDDRSSWVIQSGKRRGYVACLSEAIDRRPEGAEHGGATNEQENGVPVVLERKKESRDKTVVHNG